MKLPHQFYYKVNRLQQIRGFYYVVKTGSMLEASRKMGITQSAITLQIQALERDLGIVLFNRKGKKIEVTDIGKELYSLSLHYVQGIDDLFKTFLFYDKKAKQKHINIGANHVSISYILPKYVKEFKNRHDDVTFDIRNLNKNDGIERVINDEIDFLIYPMQNQDVPIELNFVPIVTYQPILLIKKDHPLATKKNLKLADIAKYELVRIDPHLITLPGFEEIVKANNFKTSISFEMSDWEILKRFVESEIGVAMISNIVLEGNKEGLLTQRLLTDYFPEMTYGILCKKGKSFDGFVKEFIDMLKTEKLLEAQIQP